MMFQFTDKGCSISILGCFIILLVFQPFVKQGYMSGGAGYVVSREGLRLIVEKGFGIHKNCRKDEGGAEDVHFGECAQAVGIIAGDSRDSLGRERFHPFPPDAHFRKIDKGNWLWSYNYYPLKTGTECCSDTSIAYHYVSPDWMYVLEYFVYHWHPYGIVRDVDAVRKVMKLDAHEHGFQVESEHHHDSSQDSGKAVEGRESLDEERKRLEEQRKKVEEDQKKAEDAMKAVLDEKSKMQKMHAEALDLQKKADETMTKAKEEMKKAEALGVEVLKMKSQKDQKM